MSTYAQYQITTREQLKEWILKMLGEPLITVEITEEQLDFVINNALEIFTKYALQDEKALVLDLNQYEEDKGIKLPDNVTEVFSLEDSGFPNRGVVYAMESSSSAFSTLFGRYGFFDSFITYDLLNRYIELVKRVLAIGYTFEYNPRTKYLTLTPDPIKKKATDQFIVVECRCIRPEEQLYGEEWVKKYALAEAKILIGTIRGKFEGVQLLGGGNISTAIKDEGVEERNQLLEELQAKESGIFGFYVG